MEKILLIVMLTSILNLALSFSAIKQNEHSIVFYHVINLIVYFFWKGEWEELTFLALILRELNQVDPYVKKHQQHRSSNKNYPKKAIRKAFNYNSERLLH